MSTFYSDLAQTAINKGFSDINSDFTHIEDKNSLDDLDNILNSIENSSPNKTSQEKRITGDNKNNDGNPNSTNIIKGELDDSWNTVSLLEETGKTNKTQSRKNILDALIDPFESENTWETSLSTKSSNINVKEPEKSKMIPTTKRSVRFSDMVHTDDGMNYMENSKEPVTKNDMFDDLKSVDSNRSRPVQQKRMTSKPENEFASSLESFITEKLNDHKTNKNVTDGGDAITAPRMKRPSSLDSMNNRMDELDFPLPKFSGKLSGKMSTSENSSVRTVELEAKLKKLELERVNCDAMVELLKKQHKEELEVVEKASRSKFELLEESASRREHRLREELQFLEEQNRDRLQSLEQQRDKLMAEYSSKLNEMRAQNANAIEQLKLLHEQELSTLKTAHDESMTQIKMACQKETTLLSELTPNTDQLKRLLTQLIEAATDLGRTESERLRDLDSQREQLLRREERIRLDEGRMRQKEEALDRERKRTADILAKLEHQMKENLKMVSEDKWIVKQEQERLLKLQAELEEERRSLMEHAGRERAEIQQLVVNFIGEHRKLYAKCADERSQISEQHQKMKADQITWEEKKNVEEASLRQTRDEIEALKEALAAERRALDERANRMRIDEVKLEETRRQLDIVRCDLARQQSVINDREQYLADQLSELTCRTEAVRQAEKSLVDAESRQQQMKQEQAKQLEEIKARNERLHEAEKKLLNERKELAKQHADLLRLRQKLGVDHKSRFICSECRLPVKDKADIRLLQLNGFKNRQFNGIADFDLHNDSIPTKYKEFDVQDDDTQFLEREKRYLAKVQKVTDQLQI